LLSYFADIKTSPSLLAELDAELKASISIMLTLIALVCDQQVSLSLVFLYLVLATVLLGSNFRFLLKNMLSYALIFLMPYFFGLLLSMLVSSLVSKGHVPADLVLKETVLRMVRLFFVWYIGSLYLCSTPLHSILGLLKHVLAPLNRWGVPVSNALTLIMCIVLQLTASVSEFKKTTVEQARTIFQDKSTCFKNKLNMIANLLVFSL